MTQNEWETTQRFIFTSDYPLGLLLAAGGLVAFLIVVSAWWELRRGARRWMLLTLPLRLIALGVVLWMLAGPAMELVRRRASKRSIALLIDTSASMRTVDPFDADANILRWTAATSKSQAQKLASLVGPMDKATSTLLVAQIYMHRLGREAPKGLEPKTPLRLLRHVRLLLSETQLQIRSFKPALEKDDPELARELETIVEQMDERISPAINDLVKSASQETSEEFAESLERRVQAERQLAELARKMRGVADSLALRHVTGEDAKVTKWLEQEGATARHEKVAALLSQADEGLFRRVKDKADLRIYQFGREVTPLDLETLTRPEGREEALGDAPMTTDLASAMEQMAREHAEREFEALVVISDGRHNAPGDVLRAAAALTNLPTLIVPIGNVRPVRDVILHHPKAPRTVIINDMIMIEAMVNAHGCLGEALQVELLEGDQVIDHQRLEVSSENFMGHLAFRRKAVKMGEKVYALQIKPLPDERIAENNRIEFSVEVIENKIRVLLVDQLPRWEHRFLRNLFKRDEHIEYTEVLLSAPDQSEINSAATLPQDLEELCRYRVVILGDVGPSTLDAQQQSLLDQYVSRRGGTLILIAGRDYMPGAYEGQTLGRMAPVETHTGGMANQAGYRLYLTEEGRAMDCLSLADESTASERVWRELFRRLPVYNLSESSKPKPTSHVVIGARPANGDEPSSNRQSFLNWHEYGRGRVVFLAAPVSYQLRYQQGDRYHHRFWGQILRWAVAREMGTGSQCVQLLTDKDRYAPGDPIQVTLRLTDPRGLRVSGGACAIGMDREDKSLGAAALEEAEDEPGVYRATLDNLAPGTYALKAIGPAVENLLKLEKVQGDVEIALVVNETPTVELSETRCDTALLGRIAEATGGALVPPTGLESALAALDLDPDFSETVTQRSLWDRWPFLWLFVGCLGLEWTIRKLRGMA